MIRNGGPALCPVGCAGEEKGVKGKIGVNELRNGKVAGIIEAWVVLTWHGRVSAHAGTSYSGPAWGGLATKEVIL